MRNSPGAPHLHLSLQACLALCCSCLALLQRLGSALLQRRLLVRHLCQEAGLTTRSCFGCRRRVCLPRFTLCLVLLLASCGRRLQLRHGLLKTRGVRCPLSQRRVALVAGGEAILSGSMERLAHARCQAEAVVVATQRSPFSAEHRAQSTWGKGRRRGACEGTAGHSDPQQHMMTHYALVGACEGGLQR